MNLSTIIGIVGCFAMVVMAIYTSGGSIVTYLDLPSFFMTVIGSYLALFIFCSVQETIGLFATIGLSMKQAVFNEEGVITKLLAFSDKARREGLLALEEELEDLDDEFMKKGMRLVVDGTDGAIIRELLENELSQIQERHMNKISVVNMWGTVAPGLGMIGTVVGLIAMLKNLEDKSALGPNMAVALITTLYGALIANIVAIPLAGKLKARDALEVKVKEMEIEGILSIQAGENTRVLATKLLSYLNPVVRKKVEQEVLRD
ncbi:MAG: MotA/TolQ/ExbB proton channel family protein [Treponema sp.]|jgi:chemotaxis protein MotA|nr:MotA/TolQ/ExbB proton channel family protein [Treponema sp.]